MMTTRVHYYILYTRYFSLANDVLARLFCVFSTVWFILCFYSLKTRNIPVKVLYKAFYDFAGRENVNIRDKIFQDRFCGAKTVSLQTKIGHPYAI